MAGGAYVLRYVQLVLPFLLCGITITSMICNNTLYIMPNLHILSPLLFISHIYSTAAAVTVRTAISRLRKFNAGGEQ